MVVVVEAEVEAVGVVGEMAVEAEVGTVVEVEERTDGFGGLHCGGFDAMENLVLAKGG